MKEKERDAYQDVQKTRRLLPAFIIARTFNSADQWNLNDDDDGVRSNDRGLARDTRIMREEEKDEGQGDRD
ncbi:methyl-accepting chemotaxis protein [Sesbania bispinosa]|nr:methyl-accepting chemotaxis protein [Sesbania bispinosa]